MKKFFVDEINDTINKVLEIQKEQSNDEYSFTKKCDETKNNTSNILSLCILTDSHYTENGGCWQDTAENIKKVLQQMDVDGIVHLGDFTEGIEKKEKTAAYVKTMLADLEMVPLYITLGNHDANFVKGNPEPFSLKEQLQLFGLEKAYYVKDFQECKIRCLFLQSYDMEVPVRYGFSDMELEWVKQKLEETPQDYKVLVFAHAAPLPHLDYWSRLIRNGKELIQILEDYNEKENRQLLAYIHGHTHAEHVYKGCSFPIISIGCNKCEKLPDKRIPRGAYVYDRQYDTVSQDLWDVLLVDSNKQQLNFIRFGAGEDRTVDCHKNKSIWKNVLDEKRKARKTKIWAHRGSSGFAPENTLPAFEIAKALDVDGITLEVQMTKDGELVVIHDETIDRTSDGTGRIIDYTLEELRQFNFAKDKPLFGFVTIPTLKEVYQLFQDTDYTILVEWSGLYGNQRNAEEERKLESIHMLTEEMGMTKQVIYSAYDYDDMKQIEKYVSGKQIAVYVSGEKIGFIESNIEKHGQILCSGKVDFRLQQFIQNFHEKEVRVLVKDVNAEEEARLLQESAADVIITNHPGKMREAL